MTQLALGFESSDDEWRLDQRTREVGRRGVAEARRALEAATGAHPERPAA